ncbi:MAG: ABC transporter ATP-binding protein [Rhodobacteraceae bacterium]|nr:ABC transporter ATP-binding protein [Paracoccaceae bacterium]
MDNIVLKLKNVSLTLTGNAGDVEILKDISFSVDKGETVGLTGPSGSGKSSLLMLMGGLEQASAGEVSVLGRDLNTMNEDQLARFRMRHFGIVFQSFHLIPTMTALENIATPLELAGQSHARDKARQALESVGLADRADHYPSQMSGGEQQRTALARAAAPSPDILLADEPTGNLDEANGKTIMDLMFGLRDAHGSTLILVTHDHAIASLCSKSISLRDGRLQAANLTAS